MRLALGVLTLVVMSLVAAAIVAPPHPADAGIIIPPGRGGATGPTGSAGVTGPTGPNWTTCAAMATSMSGATTGTCGSAVLSVAPAFTGAVTFSHSGVALASTSSGNVAIAATGQSSSSAITATNSSTGPAATLTQTNGGYALVLTPDLTSPARAPLLIQAQDAEPTGVASIGTMYVAANGALEVSSTSATPGTFQSVGNIGKLSTIAAAGTNQATATAMGAGVDFVTITAANGTTGTTLPSGSVARCVRAMSQVVGSNLNMYGHNSDNDTINGGAADAVYAQLGGTSLVYCTANGTDWFTY